MTLKTKQSGTIDMLMTKRNPIAEALGKATPEQNAVARFAATSVLTDNDPAERENRIAHCQAAYTKLTTELDNLKNFNLSAKSLELHEDVRKHSETLTGSANSSSTKNVVIKLKDKRHLVSMPLKKAAGKKSTQPTGGGWDSI